MSDELAGLTCYGWTLQKPFYYSAGGRLMRARNVWIMTVDNYLVHGFGVVGREARFTVTRYASAAVARKHAVAQTQRREKEGFILNDEPRTLVARGGKRDYMEGLVGASKANADLLATVKHLMKQGKPLSPEVVPHS